jgi:hypothetical protein
MAFVYVMAVIKVTRVRFLDNGSTKIRDYGSVGKKRKFCRKEDFFVSSGKIVFKEKNAFEI